MPDTPPSSDDDAPTVLKRFDRQINMYCEKKFLYKADSVLIVQDKAVLDMIEKDKAGIGQIFWYVPETTVSVPGTVVTCCMFQGPAESPNLQAAYNW